MTTPSEPTPLANILQFPSRAATSAPEADDIELSRRREIVRVTMVDVPKHMAKYRMAPEFERAATKWTGAASLVLLGPTGTGKTSCAARIVERICALGVKHGGRPLNWAQSICWADAGELGRAGGSDDDAATTLLRRASHARLLVLDDVARPNDTVQLTLRARLRRRLPTLVTGGARNIYELQAALGGDAVLRHVLEATGTPGKVLIAKEAPKPPADDSERRYP